MEQMVWTALNICLQRLEDLDNSLIFTDGGTNVQEVTFESNEWK